MFASAPSFGAWLGHWRLVCPVTWRWRLWSGGGRGGKKGRREKEEETRKSDWRYTEGYYFLSKYKNDNGL